MKERRMMRVFFCILLIFAFCFTVTGVINAKRMKVKISSKCKLSKSSSFIHPDDIQTLKKYYNDSPEIFKAIIIERDYNKVKTLVDADPSLVNARNKYQMTPLHQAAYVGDMKIVEYLVSKGADIEAKNNRGCTPIHSCAAFGHDKVLRFLISKGADVNSVDNYGWSPLDGAICQDRHQEILILKRHGAKASKIK
jgi:ankyrin repeat protein